MHQTLQRIDENLCRAELTPAQRAASVARRAEIWGKLHPEENQVGEIVPPEIGYKKPPQQSKAFAAETSKVSGQDKREVNRHLARGRALGSDLEAITGTSFIAAGFLEYEREQAKMRQAAVGGSRPGALPETFPEPGEARDKAGERMHVSGRTVDDEAESI